jgi:hypothetical protein
MLTRSFPNSSTILPNKYALADYTTFVPKSNALPRFAGYTAVERLAPHLPATVRPA